MKKIVFIFGIILGTLNMNAQHRSQQEAIQIAQDFFSRKQPTNPNRLAVVPQSQARGRDYNKSTMNETTQPNSYYVINDSENNRFVIVSSDERLNDILGYSDSGSFDKDYMPEAIFDILHSFDRQYNYLLNYENKSNIVKSTAYSTSNEVIEPMITTKWGQMTPFNLECPKDPDYGGDTLCATGCVATAMAQIINYHKYPSRGNGSSTYISSKHSIKGYMDFDNYEINYSNLVDDLNSSTNEQKAEVAKLMHACGISLAMDYCYDGSGTMDYNVPYALINNFGYNRNVVYRNRDYYTNEEWNDMIMNDLRASRPIMYSGYNEDHKSGHTYILDGRDKDGLYHFNFGNTQELFKGFLLSSPGDGYYQLNAIKPTFIGSVLGDYSYYQSMVCNISPSTVGEYEDIFYASLFDLTQVSLLSPVVYYTFFATCYSSDTNSNVYSDSKFSGEIGIGLFDTDFNFISSMYSEHYSCKSSENYIKTIERITLNISAMEDNKTYYVAPYIKGDNSDQYTLLRGKVAADLDSDEYKNNAYHYYEAKLYFGEYLLLYPDINVNNGLGIENTTVSENGLSPKSPWYTIQGVRLDSKPTKSGIYIKDGRKIIVK